MSNIIGGGAGSTPVNHLQFQQTATKAAFTRGDVGNLGKKETKMEEPDDSVGGTGKFEKLPNGTSVNEFADGSKQFTAKNGVSKDVDSQGNMTSLNLPNGARIERDEDGSLLAFDPKTGDYGEVTASDAPAGGKVFSFEDSDGNKFNVSSDDLSFSAQNPSETLTQTVHNNGAMDIETKTLSRDPVSGKFSQDETHVYIGASGNVYDVHSNYENLAINNQGISFTSRGDMNIGIKLPYPPPQELKGAIVRPDMPPITEEPTMPPPQQQPSAPPHHGGGCCPGPQPGGYPGMPGGMPGMPEFYPGMPGMPGNGYQQFPWAGYPMPGGAPPLPPGPLPGTPPPVNDPFAPIMTPGGMIRQLDPSGMFTISLPNGIVMNQLPDGKCQAFDARTPGAVLPVTTSEVENPGFGRELSYNFQDGEGNLVTMYSKSMDFAVASRDGNTLQTVSPNGDMLINARTYPPGPDGMPQMRNHKILVGANGRVSTFGEPGIQVNNKNIVFAEGGNISNYKLPYEIPPHQGLMPYIPPIGFPSNPMQPIPVPDPVQPSLHVGADGIPKVGGQPPPINGEPDFPPGHEAAKDAEAPKTDAPKADGAKTSDAGKAEAKKEAPAEQPVKPGIWKRIKNFFTGDSTSTGKTHNTWNSGWNQGWCRGSAWGSPYPCGYYNPWGGMGMGMGMGFGMGMGMPMGFGMGMGAGTAIGLGIGATAMLAGSMMYPMGMYCNPFGMFGMYGMW